MTPASLCRKVNSILLLPLAFIQHFCVGEYDTAIFQAFREVEVAVRQVAKFTNHDYGTDMMRAAFKPAERKGEPAQRGPLTDQQLPIAEQEAMSNLFAGAVGLYKNPQSHRHVMTDPEEATEVIVFASHLMRLVDMQRSRTVLE